MNEQATPTTQPEASELVMAYKKTYAAYTDAFSKVNTSYGGVYEMHRGLDTIRWSNNQLTPQESLQKGQDWLFEMMQMVETAEKLRQELEALVAAGAHEAAQQYEHDIAEWQIEQDRIRREAHKQEQLARYRDGVKVTIGRSNTVWTINGLFLTGGLRLTYSNGKRIVTRRIQQDEILNRLRIVEVAA